MRNYPTDTVILTPYGRKRLHHQTLVSALSAIAERYGWRLTSIRGQLAMVERPAQTTQVAA
ncbi:hypothetical protein C7446_2345 [Kushneria sinocarnis]|uniref:Uncharacterized protein n=1 Tax=Kushneria sinocarnis TaxID=595502 RepID=A0A420WVP8_9GAMM|nr:hypothetical protein C7446_2345 [Kushneria sinocarnis]